MSSDGAKGLLGLSQSVEKVKEQPSRRLVCSLAPLGMAPLLFLLHDRTWQTICQVSLRFHKIFFKLLLGRL
jgi:hypothetical protein